MKRFFERLLIILFPVGVIYCIGKALFYRGDFTSFMGCLFIGLVAFIGGGYVIHNHPAIVEFIDKLFNAIKSVFA